MMIFNVTSFVVNNADISYNTYSEGMWAVAEISFGIIVTCTFSLPKFIEAKGTKIRGVLSSLTRPFASLTSVVSFSRMDATASPDLTLDRVSGGGHSESNISFAASRDREIERYLPEEGVQTSAKYPSFDITNSPNDV